MILFETLAGDYRLKKDNMVMLGMVSLHTKDKKHLNKPLSEIVRMELIDAEVARTVGRTAGLAVLGAVIAGPLGLAAGFFGKKSEARFAVLLNDGTRFAAACSQRGFRELTKPMVLDGRYAGPGMTILQGMQPA